jgi:AcrR family transcriptional regulator
MLVWPVQLSSQDEHLATSVLNRREDARIVRSREALRVALLDLIERRPFEAITIREITDHASVGYATFYRHYPTKGALLDDIAADQIRALVSLALPVLASHNSREACLAKFRYVEQHRSLWHALLTGGAASTVREEIIQISREVAADYAPTDHWLPVDLSFRFVASALVEVLTWWLERDGAVSVEVGAELLDRLVIAPVVNPAR